MNKNLIVFVVFSAAVLAGWSVLQNQIWPPKPPGEQKDAIVQAKDPAKADEPGKKDAPVEPKKTPEDKKTPDDKKGKEDPKTPPAKEVVPPEPAKKAQTFTLGDAASYLNVMVTTRGAGVQQLKLSKFEGADYLGRRDHRELELIQDDPISPSFRMYHYPNPTDIGPPVLGLGEMIWNADEAGVVADGKGWKIAFWAIVPGQSHLKITKTYRLQPQEYHLGLNLEIEHLKDSKAEKAAFRYQLTGAHGLPIEGEWYTTPAAIRSAVIGIVDDRNNLARSMEDSARVSLKDGGERVSAGNSWIQYAGVMTQYFASVIVTDPSQKDLDGKKSHTLDYARPTRESTEIKARILKIDDDRITIEDKVGLVMECQMLPRATAHLKELKLKEKDVCVVNFSRAPETQEPIVHWFRKGQTPHQYFDDLTVRVNSETLTFKPGEKRVHQFQLYHGPVKTKLLGQYTGDHLVSPELVDFYTYQVHLRTLTDYHSDTSVGWFFSKIGWTDLLIACTRLMHWLLNVLQYITFGNYGLCIILLTVVVRGALFPISRKQALMSQKMQELAPEIKKLQEKYKNDNKGKAEATMELYRKHKVHPIGGCLPLFLQMPIFLGLYYCLQESVQFRLAKFLWIDNLAAPDMMFWWGEGVPWINDPDNLGGMLYLGPFFNLLPIIAVAFMVIQQKMLTPPAQTEEQEVQQKTMQFMMAAMGIFFYKVAAGLCLYFIASSIWGVAERKLLPKKKTLLEAAPETALKPILNAKERTRERERKKTEPVTRMEKLKAWWQKLLESAEKK